MRPHSNLRPPRPVTHDEVSSGDWGIEIQDYSPTTTTWLAPVLLLDCMLTPCLFVSLLHLLYIHCPLYVCLLSSALVYLSLYDKQTTAQGLKKSGSQGGWGVMAMGINTAAAGLGIGGHRNKSNPKMAGLMGPTPQVVRDWFDSRPLSHSIIIWLGHTIIWLGHTIIWLGRRHR